jgi:hypothetical protein
MYHKCLLEVVKRAHEHKLMGDPNAPVNKVGVMVATHSEETIRFAVRK